jgi:hypothetical protein
MRRRTQCRASILLTRQRWIRCWPIAVAGLCAYLRRAYPHLVQRAAARSLPLVLDSYPATFQIEDLAAEAGVTPDDVRDYLRREIERRQLQKRDEQPALVPERAEA